MPCKKARRIITPPIDPVYSLTRFHDTFALSGDRGLFRPNKHHCPETVKSKGEQQFSSSRPFVAVFDKHSSSAIKKKCDHQTRRRYPGTVSKTGPSHAKASSSAQLPLRAQNAGQGPKKASSRELHLPGLRSGLGDDRVHPRSISAVLVSVYILPITHHGSFCLSYDATAFILAASLVSAPRFHHGAGRRSGRQTPSLEMCQYKSLFMPNGQAIRYLCAKLV